MLTAEQSALLNAWYDAQAKLQEAKAIEADLRQRCGEFVFVNAQQGANTIEIGNGYGATYTKKIGYKLVVPPTMPDAKVPDAARQLVQELAHTSNEGAFIADRLVKWEPKLSVTEYRLLPPQLKAVVDKYVLTYDQAPTLEVKEPKKAGRKVV